MSRNREFFNCSKKHEVEYLASKFEGPKTEVIAKIKELCKIKKIHYSRHKDAEQALIDAGYKKKVKKGHR